MEDEATCINCDEPQTAHRHGEKGGYFCVDGGHFKRKPFETNYARRMAIELPLLVELRELHILGSLVRGSGLRDQNPQLVEKLNALSDQFRELEADA